MDSAVKFHDELAYIWTHKYSQNIFNDRLQGILRAVKGMSLQKGLWVDAGCGSGEITRKLAGYDVQLIGYDASPKMIQNALSLNTNLNLRFELIKSIDCLPLQRATVDFILCSSVLEYIADINKVINEFYRVLKPGGTLLITVPSKYSLVRNIQKSIFTISKKYQRYIQYSINDFSVKSVSALLINNGFSVTSAGKLIGNRYIFSHMNSLLLIVGTKVT